MSLALGVVAENTTRYPVAGPAVAEAVFAVAVAVLAVDGALQAERNPTRMMTAG
jgi:hypothetical protein